MSPTPDAVVLNWRADLSRERAFLSISSLLFLISAGISIYCSRSMAGSMAMPGGWTMSTAWMRMPRQTWFTAALNFAGMWVVMMIAMMLPSLAVTLLQYRRSIRGGGTTHLNCVTLIATGGYFFVWAVFGILVYPLGVSLSTAEMTWPNFTRVVPQATGFVLLLAGVLQLTRWKACRLGRCRTGTVCHAESSENMSTWHHGIQLGRDCVLCCAGFMAVLLVEDPMSIVTMGLVTAMITVERLAQQPERIARLFGVVIIAISLPMILGSTY
jgi:predicted metal-binding membrane protein